MSIEKTRMTFKGLILDQVELMARVVRARQASGRAKVRAKMPMGCCALACRSTVARLLNSAKQNDPWWYNPHTSPHHKKVDRRTFTPVNIISHALHPGG